jgi:hypothetical protein
MKEYAERIVKVGFSRKADKVIDEVEQVTASMLRGGWLLRDTCVEDSLEKIHLIFEREIPEDH